METDTTNWPEADYFQSCVAELVKAKEAMTNSAVGSNDSKKIKIALVSLLESNKVLITALDKAYKNLHDARINMHNSL